MKKGQLSIEIVILLAIFLLFFQAMILPTIEFSENILQDTQAIVITKKNIDNLATNIEQLSNQEGYGQRKVYFYLPSNAIMKCNNTLKQLDYNITISKQQPIPSQCDNMGLCSFNKQLLVRNIDCNAIGPGHKGIITILKKIDGNITIG